MVTRDLAGAATAVPADAVSVNAASHTSFLEMEPKKSHFDSASRQQDLELVGRLLGVLTATRSWRGEVARFKRQC